MEQTARRKSEKKVLSYERSLLAEPGVIPRTVAINRKLNHHKPKKRVTAHVPAKFSSRRPILQELIVRMIDCMLRKFCLGFMEFGSRTLALCVNLRNSVCAGCARKVAEGC